MTATIYVLTDAVGVVRYVGQTRIDVEQRLRRHWVTALAGAREHRAVWMRAVHAAGGAVVIRAIDCVPSNEADAAEVAHVAKYLALGCDLTNRTAGGRGNRSWEVSDETRRKMSASASRRKVSPEGSRRRGDAIRGSEKHRLFRIRLHASNRRPCSPETRRRISAALRGEPSSRSSLTWAIVEDIRTRFMAGAQQAELCRIFHMTPPTIHNIVRFKTWVPA